MHPELEALFRPAPAGGHRLYLHHAPAADQPVLGALVYVHPWAEEMNKSRRMAAQASRALASRGWAVLQIDLLGCGDSSGQFAEASWDEWLVDVIQAAAWLMQRHPGLPLWLWGLRAGALLAAAAATRVAASSGITPNLLFWHPSAQGKATLQQFLRLKAAAQMAHGGAKPILDAARSALANGQAVEVAGYTLSAALASGLEQASLQPPGAPPARLIWLELADIVEIADIAEAGPAPAGVATAKALSPATRLALQTWARAGWQVDVRAVAGPAFWQTVELEDAPNLVEATCIALDASMGVGCMEARP